MPAQKPNAGLCEPERAGQTAQKALAHLRDVTRLGRANGSPSARSKSARPKFLRYITHDNPGLVQAALAPRACAPRIGRLGSAP
jgi:hypothetical protein